MTAGYCWPWSEPNPDNSLVPDIVIGDWARPWNAKLRRDRLGSVPSSDYWATAEGGFDQWVVSIRRRGWISTGSA